MSLTFMDEGAWYISRGGESSSPKFWGVVAHKVGGGLTDLEFFLRGGGVGRKGWGQYFRVGIIPCRKLWKGKTDTYLMSQTLVLSIKLAIVSSIPFRS